MGREIERKFLLRSDTWRHAVSHSARMVQGYLLRGDKSAVRVRIMDDTAELNISTRWTASIGSSTSTRYRSATPARSWNTLHFVR